MRVDGGQEFPDTIFAQSCFLRDFGMMHCVVNRSPCIISMKSFCMLDTERFLPNRQS
jgi:hypothetical protein